MKKLLLTTIVGVVWVNLFAQTTFNQPAKSSLKHVVLFVQGNSVAIAGSSKNEISVEIDKPIKMPEMSDGLKRVYVKGLQDNTNLGLNISQEDSILVIREVCNCNSGMYKIVVPQNLHVIMLENSQNHGSNWRIVDMKGGIDLKSEFGNIYLQNVLGNIKAYTRHGKINAELTDIQNVNLSSTFGKVSLEVKPDVKANLKITGCKWGDIFTDFELPQFSTNEREISTQLNGGGNSFIQLSSEHSDIFLRKMK